MAPGQALEKRDSRCTARAPADPGNADTVQAYPRHERLEPLRTQSIGHFGIVIMCKPLQQGSISSVVRAMVL